MEAQKDISPSKQSNRSSILLDERFSLKPDQPPPPPPTSFKSSIDRQVDDDTLSMTNNKIYLSNRAHHDQKPSWESLQSVALDQPSNNIANVFAANQNSSRDVSSSDQDDGERNNHMQTIGHEAATTPDTQLARLSTPSADTEPKINSLNQSTVGNNKSNGYHEHNSIALSSKSASLSSSHSSSNNSQSRINLNSTNDQQQPTLESRFRSLEELMSSGPTILGSHSINCELLIDLLNAIYYDCQSSGLTRSKNQQKFLELIEPLVQQINQLRLQAKDFDLIRVIGFGNFGQVSVVKSKEDNKIYAMKTLSKIEMLRRAETACYREERDILLHGSSHDWFTKLHHSFQDETNLYLIMDYYIGGDLLTLFSKYDDFLPEDMSKFYSAQIIMAISVLHDMGFIHRDIKPDNILLDQVGHARLADFGSCLKVSSISSDGICTIAVGTPDYISPDVLKAMEGDKKSGQLYDYDIDWWSLGVVIFESLFGETPFYAESLAETYSKIMNHETCFKFPEEPKVSDEAKDLLSHLICNRSKRFRSIEQFKSHKWFQGLDWENLRHAEPPYKPVISGPDDTSNFDIDDTRPSNLNDSKNNPLGFRSGKESVLNVHLPFVGFTATFSARESKVATKSSGHDHIDGSLLASNLQHGLCAGEKVAKEATNSTHSQTILERPNGSESIDVQQLESDLTLAREQWSELSHLVNEIRKEKLSLSNQLRGKEHEIEELLDKMSELRKSVTVNEKIKRQQADDISRLTQDLERERFSNYNYQKEISNLEGKLQTAQRDSYSSRPIDIEADQVQPSTDKDEIIGQQRDYIAHLEEQVLKLQQQQPNWDRQVAAAKNLDPENIYINSLQVEAHKLEHNPNTTWQERRSAKAERHEFKELQLTLQNELDDKRRIHNDLEDKKRELCQALTELAELKKELIRSEQQKHAVTSTSNAGRSQPFLSQSMLFNTNLTSEADFVASLKRESSSGTSVMQSNVNQYNNFSSNNNLIAYQAGSNLSNQSTYVADMSSGTEEGYSEAESAYRQIRQYQPLSSLSNPPILSPRANSVMDPNRIYSNLPDNNRNSAILNNQRSLDSIKLKSPTSASSHNRHMFVVRTFIMPIKCNLCTSLMTGIIRQGLVCESCGFACHESCAKALKNMSCPYDEKKFLGLDPQRGIGTAYSGYVRIPRPGGVRKGWMRIYVVVCDFKLFLYDLGTELSSSNSSSVSLVGSSSGRDDSVSSKSNLGVSVSRIIDLRDENFSVTSVLESDVIHASRTDISCIFRLSSTMIGDEHSPPMQRHTFYQLMLVDKEGEKIKWIEALVELHRIVKRNNLPHRNFLAAYSSINTFHLPILRHTQTIHCCTIIEDGPKLLLGTDEALVCCYLDLGAYHRLPKGKRALKLDILESEQLIVAMSGRQRHIKLIPMRALESDNVIWIKMPETKNATTFIVHKNLPGSFISVAVKKSLYVYEITRRQLRYAPWQEIQSNAVIQTLNSSGRFVIVGTCSNFHVHDILSRDSAPLYLISNDCVDLVYIIQNPFEPLGCYEIKKDKWLLVFENHGVFVNSFGYKTQDADLQFVTKCNAIASLSFENSKMGGQELLILAFSSNHIDVYNAANGEWLQTINSKHTKPLQDHATDRLICITASLDLPMIVQIAKKGVKDTRLVVQNTNQAFSLKSSLLQKLSKEGSLEGAELQRKVSRIHISEPSDFQHLTHLGPATQPSLIDLNNISTAQQQQQVLMKVKTPATPTAIPLSRHESVDETKINSSDTKVDV